jgi:signal transduction histidine kinase
VRVAVLPRDVSARVITSALARSFGAVNAVSLGLAIPILLEYAITRDIVGAAIVPLIILVVLVGLAALTAVRPTISSVIAFLVVGAVGATLFQVLLIQAHPPILGEALYMLNRPAVALVLVGVTASSVRAGVVWAVVGFWLSNMVTLGVTLATDVPFTPGWGPALNLVLVFVAYGALWLIQLSLRRRVPDFDQLEQQTRRDSLSEDLKSRVTAAVHDTLLNDLSLVMNAPDELDDRMRTRLRDDLATLRSAEWLRQSAAIVVDDQDSELRNRVMQVIADLQWRGLTVHVTGSGTGIYRVAPEVPDVLLAVLRACLENVLKHSGVTIAEVDLGFSDTHVSLVVTDQGEGFDPAEVPDDRLGLTHSVIERVRSVGGTTKIWSTPGAGTSIVISVPFAHMVTPNEKPRHGDA